MPRSHTRSHKDNYIIPIDIRVIKLSKNSEVKNFYHFEFTDLSDNPVQNTFWKFFFVFHHHCSKKEIQSCPTYEKFQGDSTLQIGLLLRDCEQNSGKHENIIIS